MFFKVCFIIKISLIAILCTINAQDLITNNKDHFKIYPLETKDSLLVKKILKNTPLKLLKGSYSITTSFNDSTQYILLHNGTEVNRFLKNKIKLNNLIQPQKNTNHREKIFDDTSSLLLDKITNLHSLLKMGSWNEGVNISYQFFTSNNLKVQGFKSELNYLSKWKYLYYGASIKNVDFKTSTADKFKDFYGSKYNDYGWSFVVGIPFLKYEVENFQTIFPEYTWLEKDIISLFYQNKPGEIISMYDDGLKNSYTSSFAHKIYFKFGYLHYDLIINNSAYTESINRLYLDELPGIKGTWGLGFVQILDLIVPEVWFDFNGFDIYSLKLNDYLLPLKMSPFKLYFAYLDKNNYRLVFELNLHLDIKRN